MIYALDIFGTFTFAVSGAFRAVQHELDLLGGACFVAAERLGCGQSTQLLAAVAVTFVLRVLAMKYGISLPKVRSLPASPSQLTRLRKTKQQT